MIKKVVWGFVVVGLAGILTAGAIIRTAAKTGNGAGGLGLYAQEARSGQGRGSRSGDGTAVGEAQVDEWLTLEGSVVSVEDDALVVQSADGTEIVVENRPWWFAQDSGLTAQPGDMPRLTGFYEGDSLEVGQIANDRTGQTVRLREESGRPLWAGRGRRDE